MILVGFLFAACAAPGGRTGTIEAAIPVAGVSVGDQAAGALDKSSRTTLSGGGDDTITSMLLAAAVLSGAIGGGGAYPFVRKIRIRMAGDPLATLRNRVEMLERAARKEGHIP